MKSKYNQDAYKDDRNEANERPINEERVGQKQQKMKKNLLCQKLILYVQTFLSELILSKFLRPYLEGGGSYELQTISGVP